MRFGDRLIDLSAIYRVEHYLGKGVDMEPYSLDFPQFLDVVDENGEVIGVFERLDDLFYFRPRVDGADCVSRESH